MSKIRLSIMFLLLLSCTFSSLMAQAPQKMSYQAILRNSSSELIVNTIVGMRISIIQGAEDGTEVYAEVQKPSTNANGLVTVAIGTGTVLRGSFSGINWGNGPYFIKTETDPRGGASYSISGVSQFMSVPYALFAANSGSSTGTPGKSAYEIWKEQPGNATKTEADFLNALKGTDGKSAFEVWKALAGNANKTESDFMAAIKGADGKDGLQGKDGTQGEKGTTGDKGEAGVKGESVYDIWKKDPANASKTEADFLASIKGTKGDVGAKGDQGASAFEVWKALAGNATKTESDFMAAIKGADGKDGLQGKDGTQGEKGTTGDKGEAGVKGESVYDLWKKDPANAGKTEADFLASIKGTKGDAGAKGDHGASAFEVWKALAGNASKTESDFMAAIKGADGKDGLQGKDGAQGDRGLDGLAGVKGESVYDIWKKDPANAGKTEVDFLEGIKAVKGDKGETGPKGDTGEKGATGDKGLDGLAGVKGESVYDIWKKDPANAGKTEADFLEGIKAVKGDKGEVGEKGATGDKGDTGEKGESVYDVWKKDPANSGKTEADFLEGIKAVKGDKGEVGEKGATGDKGDTGEKGESVYDIWKKDPTNAGKTEADFLEGIKAVKGDKGETGPKGDPGEKGATGDRGLDGLAGEKGESVYDIWKKDPANSGKTEADFLEGIKAVKGDKGETGPKGDSGEKGSTGDRGLDGLAGEKGESVYDIWKKDPANSGKTEADFLEGIKAVKGDKGETGPKGDSGEKGATGDRGLDGLAGEKGESVYDIWKKDPANAGKTEADFLEGIKAVKGDKGETGPKGDPGEKGATGDRGLDGLAGEKGESVYDVWRKDPANAGKTEADFLEGIKAVKGDPGDKGADGKSAFDLWKEKDGNANKSLAEYEASLTGQNGKTILNGIVDPGQELGQEGDFFINTQTLTFFGPKATDGTWPAGSILNGTNGIGLDFKGSYANLAAYTAAGNAIELNKAYYNSTDKKSYIYTGAEWKVFAQDGTGGSGAGLEFNVDRNITRAGLPGVGTNMGAGKTTAQFLEDYFFPRLAATAPTAVLSGSALDIPYATWKNFSGFGTTLNLNYTVTNRSKQDDTEDKNIASIRLLSGATEVAVGTVNNSANPMTGTFANVAFSNPAGSKTADFSKTFQLEVKDEQPTTVTSNTLTAYMRKANRLTLTTPTLNPATLIYEYGTSDIPITLSWTFNKNDETVQDIKVSGVSTGSLTTVSKQVVFKAIANGGADAQSFPVAITGDIYGVTSATSPTIKWESTLYRGTISSSIAPCESGFSISDNAIVTGSSTLLGGTWKGDAGYDFVCDASGKYVFYAYPDDNTAPVIEYYDATFKAWQRYPDNQLKVITKANFENASGYKGKTYKLVFVCVEYKNATVKIRIN